MHVRTITSWSLRERLLSFVCGVTANLKTEQDTPAYVYTSTSSARTVGGTRVYPLAITQRADKQAGQHRYVIRSTYVPRLCAGRPPPLSCLRNFNRRNGVPPPCGVLLPLHSHKKKKRLSGGVVVVLVRHGGAVSRDRLRAAGVVRVVLVSVIGDRWVRQQTFGGAGMGTLFFSSLLDVAPFIYPTNARHEKKNRSFLDDF